MPTPTATIRDFTPADYDAVVAVGDRCWPDYPTSVEEMRHRDEKWDHARYFKRRIVAEVGGTLVGTGDVNHNRWTFKADKYWVGVSVLPAHRHGGIGVSLYDELERTARGRGAHALASQIKESMAEGMRFAQKLGFAEVKRDWESRLDVTSFDFDRFAEAPRRVAELGIAITTLAAELAREPSLIDRVYEVDSEMSADVPTIDPMTPLPFEEWRTTQVEAPNALPEAWFLAVKDGRYLGLSNMFKAPASADFLWQGFTGVRREARGKGIAMALKLETVRYAREHGIREIKTWNDQRNRPMLRINEAMGFVKQPAWLEVERELRP